MIGHTFAKLYATALNTMLSVELDRIGCRARGQAGFRVDYQTMDHIFMLRTIIEEAKHRSEKVYCCFVDFHKAFDSVPRVALFERLREIGIFEMLCIAIMRLYETVVGRFRTPEGFSDPIHSTIGVKKGCPLSPTLFGLYIDELEDFLLKSSLPGDGCYLHQVLISILLFADDIVLLASSPDRQHQYFQQRKRQQRSQVLEKNVDNPGNISENNQYFKSLDVASLMNICSAAQATSQPKLVISSEACSKDKGVMQGQLCSKNEQIKDHIHTNVVGLDIEPHLVQDAFIKAHTETQWMPSSGTEGAKASECTNGPFLLNLHESFQEKKPEELKDQSSRTNHPPKKFSLLDIIDDDSKNGCQERSPMEVYAAFSLEGTGKIRDKTPNSFTPMERKDSVFTKRVDDLRFDLPAIQMNASSQGVRCLFGWEDENHKKDLFSEKCSTSELFTPQIGSQEKEKNPINEREFQEISNMLSWDGSSQTSGSFMDFVPLRTNSCTLYDNCLRKSSFPNARCVMDEISNRFSQKDVSCMLYGDCLRQSSFPNARSVMDEISNTLGEEDNSYWNTITLGQEWELKGKDYKYNREDIRMASMNFPENISSNNFPYHSGLCKMANLQNNVNDIAADLDCSSSSTFNPHFTADFGTENGGDIWDSFSIDENLPTSIKNNLWLDDTPVERNWLQFDNMPRHWADLVSLGTENYSGKDVLNDALEINGCRRTSPFLPNFHKERLCEMRDDTILEKFDIDSYRAMSGDSQTSPYLGDISIMLKKSDLSMVNCCAQTKQKVTMNMSELMNDKRAPMISSSFNSGCSYDETSQSKFPTTSKPASEKSKSIVLGKMELAKKGNKTSSPLYFSRREEKIKDLVIPQNKVRNNFIKNLDDRPKLKTIFSSKNLEKKFSSSDQDESKDSQRSQDSEERSIDSKYKSCSLQIISKTVEENFSSADIDKCKGSQRMTSQDFEEQSIDSKQKSCSLQIESSFTCANEQEIIQPIVTHNHIDGVHHLELEEAQTQEKETQKTHVFHEYEHLAMCSKEQLNANPERMKDCKTQGHYKEGYRYKQSQIDFKSLQVINGNNIEPQGDKSVMDDAVSMEYQAMLESYILQLSCMNKALQKTMDVTICNKRN